MLKKAFWLVIFSSVLLQASENENKMSPASSLVNLVASTIQGKFNLGSTSSFPSSKKFPLTPTQIEAMRAKQAAKIAEEPQRIEVGSIDSLLAITKQMFTTEPREYRQISFKTFDQKYADKVEEFSSEALSFSTIELLVIDSIFDKFKDFKATIAKNNFRIKKHNEEVRSGIKQGEEKNLESLPAMIDVEVPAFGKRASQIYRIVGVTPFKDNYVDQLYDISQTRNLVEKSTHEFIDKNYNEVFNQCKPMSQSNSTEVLRAPCCQKQFHKKCVISCRDTQVRTCPNQVYNDGWTVACCSQVWDDAFYAEYLQHKPLKRKEIAKDNCSLCAASLRPEVSVTELSTKRPAKNYKKPRIK